MAMGHCFNNFGTRWSILCHISSVLAPNQPTSPTLSVDCRSSSGLSLPPPPHSELELFSRAAPPRPIMPQTLEALLDPSPAVARPCDSGAAEVPCDGYSRIKSQPAWHRQQQILRRGFLSLSNSTRPRVLKMLDSEGYILQCSPEKYILRTCLRFLLVLFSFLPPPPPATVSCPSAALTLTLLSCCFEIVVVPTDSVPVRGFFFFSEDFLIPPSVDAGGGTMAAPCCSWGGC